MTLKILIAVALVALVVVLLNVGCAAVRSGYSSAPYQVARKEGKFELRDYPALVVVEAPMRGANDSFRRLFRYIGGQNAAAEKISMTTPVFMAGETTNATMAFVLPQKMSLDRAPQPAGAELRVREIAAGKFAVLRFSGRRKAANEARALAQLEAWLSQQNLKQEGGPVYGYFDPPWTPPFLRRNEVMLRVAATP
jgi:DNA gyrase inhibitor GyrI